MVVEIENGKVKGYMTSGEYANKVGVTESTIRVWILRNKLKSLKIGETHWIKEDTPKPIPKIRGRKIGGNVDGKTI